MKHIFLAQKSKIWGSGRPRDAPETALKGRVLRAPPFGVVSGASGAVQTPNIDDFWRKNKLP
jgi:hypothetical protein